VESMMEMDDGKSAVGPELAGAKAGTCHSLGIGAGTGTAMLQSAFVSK
jgi:hypothetical protein